MKNICIFAPQRFNMIKFMENILKRAKNGYERDYAQLWIEDYLPLELF